MVLAYRRVSRTDFAKAIDIERTSLYRLLDGKGGQERGTTFTTLDRMRDAIERICGIPLSIADLFSPTSVRARLEDAAKGVGLTDPGSGASKTDTGESNVGA